MLLKRQYHEIRLDQCISDFPSLAYDFLLLQRVDQFYRREEAHAFAVMLDGLNAEGHAKGVHSARPQHVISPCLVRPLSGYCFAIPCRAVDKDDILCPIHELALMQLADQSLIDLAGREGEA